MRKYFTGMIFGLILGLSVTAYGSGMIGKAVDTTYPVYIEGQRAEMDAIAIEGVSYLPTRYIAESVGYQVDFVNKQIVLTEPANVEPMQKSVIETPAEEVSQVAIKRFTCDILDLDSPYIYKVVDGEWFYPPVSFVRYLQNEGDIFTISLPWKTVTFDINAKYSPGMVGGKINGRTFVSLTALGLKPIVNGDTVTIVRSE